MNKFQFNSINQHPKRGTSILESILNKMETKFTPIAMKCTQEQFEAVKPKLEKIGKIGNLVLAFQDDNLYLVNNYNSVRNFFDISFCHGFNRTVHEEWNEEIFLKACGIEVETLQQQLQKAEAEVKRLQSLIEEENKPKVGDWCYFYDDTDKESKVIGKLSEFTTLYYTGGFNFDRCEKITNPELIKLLENESKN